MLLIVNFSLYISIDSPRCCKDWPADHDSEAVMFDFPDTIFMIDLLIFVLFLSFTTRFHTLTLHPWREISFVNYIAPILGFLYPFYESFMDISFSASMYYDLSTM